MSSAMRPSLSIVRRQVRATPKASRTVRDQEQLRAAREVFDLLARVRVRAAEVRSLRCHTEPRGPAVGDPELLTAVEAAGDAVRNARAHDGPKPVRFVPILKGVSLETAQSIREARPRLLGFGVEDGSRRYYAGASDAARIRTAS